MKLICFLNTIRMTLWNWQGLLNYGAYTSGHEYQEQEDRTLLCMRCGHKS